MAAMTNVESTYRGETKRLGPALGSLVRQTWWLGLGVLATIGERTARVAGPLVQKGREVEPAVVSTVRQTTSDVADAAQQRLRLGRASEFVRRVRVPSAQRGGDTPTKEEFDQLAAEVRVLRERLAEKNAATDI